MHRIGVVEERVNYPKLQALFMDNLPSDAQYFNEFHALIVRHSVVACKKSPECEGCPILDICESGTSNVQVSSSQ
jgi:endonuclease-3 related protein